MTSLSLKQDNDHKMPPYNMYKINLDILINIAIISINVQKSEHLFCSRYGYSKTYFVYSQ